MGWAYSYLGDVGFWRVPLDNYLWWKVVDIESDGVYKVMPMLNRKPELENLVMQEVVINTLAEARPELGDKKILKQVREWHTKRVKKAVYHHYLDLPTWVCDLLPKE
jgi:hypothetical protein